MRNPQKLNEFYLIFPSPTTTTTLPWSPEDRAANKIRSPQVSTKDPTTSKLSLVRGLASKAFPTRRLLKLPSRKLTYPTLGKGTSSSKCHFWMGYIRSQEGTSFLVINNNPPKKTCEQKTTPKYKQLLLRKKKPCFCSTSSASNQLPPTTGP